MPRLPTMRVIGSQYISTSLPPAVVEDVAMESSSPARVVTGGQRGAAMPPLGLFVDRVQRHRAQLTDERSVDTDGARRDLGARRLVHERHEHVGEAGHGAADADAADVGAAADAGHPAALGHVAFDDRAPAADLHQALDGSVLL